MAKILIIDDERPIRETLEMFLREKGYEVATSEKGEEGLELIDRDPPDIVILDILLPGIDGLEVLRKIREVAKPMKVIMITAYHDAEMSIRAVSLGAFGYIRKPIDAAEFEMMIERAVNHPNLTQ